MELIPDPVICCVCGWDCLDRWFVLVLPIGRFYYCFDCFEEGPDVPGEY